MDLGDQAFLRRDRKHLRGRQCQRSGNTFHLTRDLGIDFGLRFEFVPLAVDLVEHHQARTAVGITHTDMITPDQDVGLGHAGVGAEHKQHRVRARNQVQCELRLRANRIQAGRIQNHQALRQQRVRKVDDGVTPAGYFDVAVRINTGFVIRVAWVEQAVTLCNIHWHPLDFTDMLEGFEHRFSRAGVEWMSDPFVRILFVLGHASGFAARLDRQQAQLRCVAFVVQQLGRAHGGAPGGGGQDAAAVVREKNRVDEFGFAARKFSHERNRQFVVSQTPEQAREARIDHAVGQPGFADPVAIARDGLRQRKPPRAVKLKSFDQVNAVHVTSE